MADKIKKISKAHIRYKNNDGKIVPGATTITGLLNKPQLVAWANRLGLEGIDSSKYRDEAAAVGTLAHEMVQCDLQDMKPDLSNYGQTQIDLAENAMLSWLEYRKQHKIEPIFCEKPLVSDYYGGTIDLYCLCDGKRTLMDFKTGKAIYDEYFFQVASYRNLLEEHGYPVEQVKVLRIGRDETEGFEERTITDTTKYLDVFMHLLEIYYLKKELKIS